MAQYLKTGCVLALHKLFIPRQVPVSLSQIHCARQRRQLLHVLPRHWGPGFKITKAMDGMKTRVSTPLLTGPFGTHSL
jgi:hypothetical protein